MPTSLDPLRGTSAQEAIEKEESTPDLTRFLLSLLFLFMSSHCVYYLSLFVSFFVSIETIIFGPHQVFDFSSISLYV
jgi:hypothetical protein